ncbi:MAG: magnesium-translocating P-type ATPase, partial [Porphyromonadaceae bacterium]|nr:magnesium-translocating P-type ATPase [Porphyromonadaceae bacterium]
MWKKKQKPQLLFNAEKVFLAASQPLESVYSYFQTAKAGLSDEEVEKRQMLYGKNIIVHEAKKNPLKMFVKAFINPFVGILTVLVVISFFMDVLMAEDGEKDWTTIIIISTMIVLSGLLRFIQEFKANKASEALKRMVTNTCLVRRAGHPDVELNIEELVPGDLVLLAAGDMIPADMRIIDTKDLFVSQSTLTGESDSIEKIPTSKGKKYHTGSVVELDNVCYMGSTVVSGSAIGIAFETGNNTYLGTIAKSIAG